MAIRCFASLPFLVEDVISPVNIALECRITELIQGEQKLKVHASPPLTMLPVLGYYGPT